MSDRQEKLCEGKWSFWVTDYPCSTTCDAGIQTRTRSCDDPVPIEHMEECLLSDGVTRGLTEQEDDFPCNVVPCPGIWSSWVVDSDDLCSTSCDDGFKARQRLCDDPAPSPGGLECLLGDGVNRALVEDDDTVPCNLGPCPGKHSLFLKCLHFKINLNTALLKHFGTLAFLFHPADPQGVP